MFKQSIGSVMATLLLLSSNLYAADHLDGPAVANDPAADINDVFAIDFALAFHAFRGDLESPGEQDNQRESDGQHENEDAEYPIRGVDVVEDDVDDLQDYPREREVGEAHLENVPALEFF